MKSPLPDAAIPHSSLVTSQGVFGKLWTETQMSGYGQACYEEGLRSAATINEMTAVADRHAHVMAMWLELVCSDYNGKFWDEAMTALGEYRADMNRIHERESPTFMGEPVLPKE